MKMHQVAASVLCMALLLALCLSVACSEEIMPFAESGNSVRAVLSFSGGKVIGESRVKKLEVQIEPRLLTAFKRIRKNARNGLAVVYIQRDACGGCFNRIPPQRQLDIKMHKKIIVCEYCGRIMVDPELAGIAAEEVNK